jgi:predicted GTPase
VWDGGNNDFSFVKPDLSIAVVDALRPGQVSTHHPGETVVRMADVVVVSAMPCDLAALVAITKPVVRARYCYAETARPGLAGVIEEFITRWQAQSAEPG